MHYICTGGCHGVSETPGTCQAKTCAKHGHDLQPCTCADGKHHAPVEEQSETAARHKIDVLTVGLAVGAGMALYVLAMGLISMFSGRGRGIVALLSEWYIGFSPTVWGSLIGAAWGFADGFLGGLIIALIYNRIKKARK